MTMLSSLVGLRQARAGAVTAHADGTDQFSATGARDLRPRWRDLVPELEIDRVLELAMELNLANSPRCTRG